MILRGIFLSLALMLAVTSCASVPEDAADDYEEESYAPEDGDGETASRPNPEAASKAEDEEEEEFAEESGTREDEESEGQDPGQPSKVQTSKHSVLSRKFEAASRLPEISDFDLLDDPQPLNRCLASRPATPDQMMEMVIRQISVSFPGTPSFGPLFPGTPPRQEASLVIGRDNGWVTASQLTEEKRRVFELHQLGNTLVIKILQNTFGIYQDFGNPAEVWIRKGQDGNLFFKVFKVDAEQNRAEAFVGYCFKRG